MENSHGEQKTTRGVSRPSVCTENEIRKNKKSLNSWKRKSLYKWIEAHQSNPNPTESQKLNLAVKLGMNKRQIDNWFVNTRKRYFQDNKLV
mmetsp:Transcript_2950/g.3618  ORF Transcript_2950/g.3618 Transcript_2950/m.3618 type:complete len:91 (+) Transcript_2950:6-278(+)